MTTFLDQPDDDQGSPQNPSQNQPGSTISETPSNSVNQQTPGKQTPGRRRQNPLSNFASYTYNLSLYMITPDAYDAFLESGRTNINVLSFLDDSIFEQGAPTNRGGGALLIAQSGGINNKQNARAPGFDLDYYIDDLEIQTIPPNSELKMSAGTTDVRFKITEPYGFSLISNLVRASKFIEQYVGRNGQKAPLNPTKQFFILGIKFIGYDDNGKILTGSENLGGTLDPRADGTGSIFQKYIDIDIVEMKFKLDGKAVNYFVRAKARNDTGLGTLRGFTQKGVKISGPTVNEILNGERGLCTSLNQLQQQYKDNGDVEYAATYSIEFDGPNSESIANASLLVPNLNNDYSFTMSPNDVKTTEDSNELASFVATPNVFSAEYSVLKDTPIVQIIELVISRSQYLLDAMKKINANSKQPENNSLKTFNQGSRTDIAWFSTVPVLTNPRWDGKQKLWVYDITYKIRRYETPIVLTPYVNPGISYYGPHKVYDYWLTGNNNEVVSYEQEFNNTYFQNVIAGAPEGLQGVEVDNAVDDTPIRVGSSTGGNKQGSVNGGQNQDFQNTYLTSLVDPNATVNAKITILGDPDYINQGEVESVNTVFNKYYAQDGTTISYGGGQVIIEINFYEGQDYNDNTGLFKINDKIVFYQQRNVDDLVDGLSYLVYKVDHKFAGGKFTQTLHCKLNNFAFVNRGGEGTARSGEQAAPSSGQTADGTPTAGNGLTKDEPIPQGAVDDGTVSSPTAPGQGTVPTTNGGQVEDEEYFGTNPPPFYDDYENGGREFPIGGPGPFGP